MQPRTVLDIPNGLNRFIKHGMPLALLLTILTVKLTSKVTLTLFVTDLMVDVIAWSYIGLLAYSTFRPRQTIHAASGALGLLFLSIRGAGFMELVISEERLDLLGAVAERALLIVVIVTYHRFMISLISSTEQTESH